LTICRLAACVLVLSVLGCDDDSGSGSSSDLGMQAQIGEEFVAQRGCAMCHQSSNKADGILSGQTTPVSGSTAYAPNLTPDVATGIGAWADIQIVRAIRYGVDNKQGPLCPVMPRYDGSDPKQAAMTDVEADAIVAYLRSLPAVARMIPESKCAGIKPPVGDLAMPPPPEPTDMSMAHD
jgi:hypothetical protein